VALRNRWRRQQLSPELRDEVTPKNILMIGPTGCGKTEISRRLAKLADAPFVKVEATKFTEVGYVGRDVEQIAADWSRKPVAPGARGAGAMRSRKLPRPRMERWRRDDRQGIGGGDPRQLQSSASPTAASAMPEVESRSTKRRRLSRSRFPGWARRCSI
jgi:hypothetical protein